MAQTTFPERAMRLVRSAKESARDPLSRRRWRNRSTQIVWKTFRIFLLVGLSFIILYPLLYTLSMAFRPWTQFADPLVIWLPREFTLENFLFALELMGAPDSLILTLGISSVSSLLQIVSCAMAGYGFARFSFKFRGVLFACMLFTIIVPPQTYIIPLYMQYRYFDFFGLGSLIGMVTGQKLTVNLINTVFTFYLPALLASGIRSGLFIYIFTQFFRGMPRELEDAAYIDGCGFGSTFLRVFVPNAVPAFLTVFFFSFVWYWNDYFFTSMFFSSVSTLSTALAGIRSTYTALMFDVESANLFKLLVNEQASVLIAIGPVLVLYVVLQRHFTESVERTGIVG